MLAAVMVPGIGTTIEDVAAPAVTGAAQVLVRNVVSTICGSDVHVASHGHPDADGAPPGFPGHESVGVVEDSSDAAFRPGDLVLCVPDLRHAGGFAEYQLLPGRFVVPLPAGTTPERAVLAQQLGTAIFAMKRFWPAGVADPSAAAAVVLGAGPVGLFFTALARGVGFPTVITSDLHEHRVEAARQMGATVAVTAVGNAVVDAVAGHTDDGALLVVEAAGTDATRVQAVDCVALDGRIGMFGMPSGARTVLPFERLFRRRPTVEFQWGAQAEPGHASFLAALRLIDDGAVDTEPLRTTLLAPQQLPQALELARAGTPVIKTGIRFT